MKIKRSQIVAEYGACPYCGSRVSLEPVSLCCGEIHGELHYELESGELVFVDDVIVIEDEVTAEDREASRLARLHPEEF